VIAQKSEGCMRMRSALWIRSSALPMVELNYANTLSILNILDADYYFKLLDCMLKQDLAGALLLYDDITAKALKVISWSMVLQSSPGTYWYVKMKKLQPS